MCVTAWREPAWRKLDGGMPGVGTSGRQRSGALLRERVSCRNAEERRAGMGEGRGVDSIHRQRRSLPDPQRAAEESGCDDGRLPHRRADGGRAEENPRVEGTLQTYFVEG